MRKTIRRDDEIDRMCEHAHKQQSHDFWKGVKYTLFWVQHSMTTDDLRKQPPQTGDKKCLE